MTKLSQSKAISKPLPKRLSKTVLEAKLKELRSRRAKDANEIARIKEQLAAIE